MGLQLIFIISKSIDFFSHASDMALDMAMSNYWMDCHEIWHKTFMVPMMYPNDVSPDFSSHATIRSNFNWSNTYKTKDIPISLSCTFVFSAN